MTKADLVNEIAINTGYDKRSITLIVENFIDEIKNSLIKGENVYLRGFGTFELKKRAAKTARNIRAKESVHVPEHSIPAFKAGAEFKEAVRNIKVK